MRNGVETGALQLAGGGELARHIGGVDEGYENPGSRRQLLAQQRQFLDLPGGDLDGKALQKGRNGIEAGGGGGALKHEGRVQGGRLRHWNAARLPPAPSSSTDICDRAIANATERLRLLSFLTCGMTLVDSR